MKYDFNLFPSVEDYIPVIRKAFENNGLERFCTKDILTKFAQFGRFLCSENEKYNLTAITDPEGIATLHFADSVIFEELFPAGATVLDIGCGAGFPSVPLAIIRPDLKITCMDATAKKIAFIQQFKDQTGLSNVNCVALRAEEAFNSINKANYREKFDIVTSRAVSKLGIICELSAGFCKTGGSIIALKGDNVESELASDNSKYSKLGLESPNIKSKAVIGAENYVRAAVCLTKDAHTPDMYPRIYSQIKSKPLF